MAEQLTVRLCIKSDGPWDHLSGHRATRKIEHHSARTSHCGCDNLGSNPGVGISGSYVWPPCCGMIVFCVTAAGNIKADSTTHLAWTWTGVGPSKEISKCLGKLYPYQGIRDSLLSYHVTLRTLATLTRTGLIARVAEHLTELCRLSDSPLKESIRRSGILRPICKQRRRKAELPLRDQADMMQGFVEKPMIASIRDCAPSSRRLRPLGQ